MASARYYVKPDDAAAFAEALLSKAGLSDEHAKLMANCLVQADARGVDTHGMARLQQYMARVSSGLVNATPDFKLAEKTPVAAHLDGDNGFGFLVATRAMAEAIRRADTYGIGIVTANHSNHFGMAATYVLQALDAGMLSIVCTNSAKQMPPFGGKQTLLGISPFAAGAPSGREVPYVLDMAPSVVAKGKIRKAARRGEAIPLGWAYDRDGRPTTDAEAALNGLMAPIGGPKGAGLAILMDVLSGVLADAAFGGEVGDQYKEARPQNVGHCFIAIKPDVFMSADAFRAVPPADGFTEVLFPGEPEHRLNLQRRREGLPFADAEKAMFDELAAQYGVPAPAMSTTPLA
ncbi:Malate/L-lactate dehydrogenase [Niveomyces insectorum RCEF 264]|uniref:Malate/L-lactate dehydrogenase n=1 Tax=Niveomyces insectorum RCEF 264 TaxID=1081102 RepID=A0A167SNV9_9HYPO|nr:Malate/L-lactate dehydrogenase [Niveomyces insectorum RCEF 264]